jgi:hypothetical protein
LFSGNSRFDGGQTVESDRGGEKIRFAKARILVTAFAIEQVED